MGVWEWLIDDFAFYVRAAEKSTNRSQRTFIRELDRIEFTRHCPFHNPKRHWSGILYQPGQAGRDSQPYDSLLAFAVGKGFLLFVRDEVAKGPYDGGNKRPLLHFAVSSYLSDGGIRPMRPEMVQLLLDYGSDPNAMHEESKKWRNRRSTWQVLLNNIDVKAEEMDFSGLERVSQNEKETIWLEALVTFVRHKVDPEIPVLPNVPVLIHKDAFVPQLGSFPTDYDLRYPLDVVTCAYPRGPWEDVSFVVKTLLERGGVWAATQPSPATYAFLEAVGVDRKSFVRREMAEVVFN